MTIGGTVTEICDQAFDECSNLKEIIIPNSVVNIGERAFSNCGLTNITIPNSITTLSDYTFYGCSALTSVTIGESVKEIGRSAFSGCDALASIYFLGTTPPTCPYFNSEQYDKINIYVPENALAAYQNADGWKKFNNLQEGNPTGIDNIRNYVADGNNKCYDLRGNRLSAPKRGLNIINGKKVMVK